MKSTFLGILLLLGLGQMILAEDARETYEVTYEVFSLPLNEAAKLKRKSPGSVAIHAHLVKKVEQKEARQEKWKVLKMISEQNFSLEEIEEFVYATEYEYDKFSVNPPRGISEFDALQFQPSAFAVPWISGYFDTKKIGDTVEGEIKVDNQKLRLRINVTHVSHITNDSFGKGVCECVMPRFSVQRILGRVNVKIGKPTLVGTISPPKENQTEKEKRIWMAFVTVEKT